MFAGGGREGWEEDSSETDGCDSSARELKKKTQRQISFFLDASVFLDYFFFIELFFKILVLVLHLRKGHPELSLLCQVP